MSGILDQRSAAQPPLRYIQARPELGRSDAVLVSGAALVHTTQIFPSSAGTAPPPEIDEQFAACFAKLERILQACHSSRDRVVKLNCYLADDALREPSIRATLAWFGRNQLPAVSSVTTALPHAADRVAIDAVIAVEPQSTDLPTRHRLEPRNHQADWCVLPPGEVIYVSGQAEEGNLADATSATLQSLLRTLEHWQLGKEHIVGLKCFVTPMAQSDAVMQAIRTFFGDAIVPPVSQVEWISSGHPIEIELIAYAPHSALATDRDSQESVSYHWLPWMSVSPVYSRAARIYSPQRIYTSGFYATTAGNGASQVSDVFGQLQTTLAQAGSDLQHLAKATYYVSEEDASGQLNALRPAYYDAQRPPAASKAMVAGVGVPGRGLVMDFIAAPVATRSSGTR